MFLVFIFKKKSLSSCKGGDDQPEDLKSALEVVLDEKKMQWGPTNLKFLIILTDSPCHGTQYHNLGPKKDNFPNEDMTPLLIQLANKNIKVIGIKFTEIVSKMFIEFTKWISGTLGDFIEIDMLEFEDYRKKKGQKPNQE